MSISRVDMSPPMSSSDVSSVPTFACVLPILVPLGHLLKKMTKLLAFGALDLTKVPRPPLAIVGMNFDAGRTVIIILIEDNGNGGCA